MEKCKGAMLATAIGDALGWPNELRAKNMVKNSKANDYFVEWTRRCGRPNWHYEKILPGEYSDDTQMTLAVARSLIAGNWEEILTKKELPFWLKYERGGGKAILRAAKSCEKGAPLWKTNYRKDYFNAGGNGAVMRILPHVIAAARTPDITALMTNVIKDAIITHGHPRAILGAACYAFALDYLLRKDTVLGYGELVTAVLEGQKGWGDLPNPEQFGEWLDAAGQHHDFEYTREWDNVRANMVRQLEYIKASLKKGLMLDDAGVLTRLECFTKVNGAGDVAVLAAIYLASRYANNPSIGIKVPAFLPGADTDTIASITGGLLGMLCGENWIPIGWRAVQDYECLVRITELLISDNSKDAARAFVAGAKEQEKNWESTPIGMMRSLGAITVQSGKQEMINITKWQSLLGQTMYFKEYKLNSDEPRKPEGKTQLKIWTSANDERLPVSVQQEPARKIALRASERTNQKGDFHDYLKKG
jgi:ADP-ribosylglycohydrolase